MCLFHGLRDPWEQMKAAEILRMIPYKDLSTVINLVVSDYRRLEND